MTHARDDHGQLRLLEVVELTGVDLLGDLEGLVVASQAALAVGLDGAVHVHAGQAPRCANITERVGVAPGQVGGDTGRLAHDGDSARVRGRVTRVLVGELGIGAEQPLDHHEVTRDVLRVGPAQGAQLATGGRLKIRGLDVVRHRGLGNARPLRGT